MLPTLVPKRKIEFRFFNIEASKTIPTVALSACLLGDNVRYDGKNKTQENLQHRLSPFLHLEKICPEVSAGLGVPRPAVELTEENGKNYAKGVADKNLDVTVRLEQASTTILKQHDNAVAFILKSRSPSCGINNTPIKNKDQTKMGSGLFAQQLIAQQSTAQQCISKPQLYCRNEQLFNTDNCNTFIRLCYLLHDGNYCSEENFHNFCQHHQLPNLINKAKLTDYLQQQINALTEIKL
jgi:uncharacterized protein YbbK (DUF523 family)